MQASWPRTSHVDSLILPPPSKWLPLTLNLSQRKSDYPTSATSKGDRSRAGRLRLREEHNGERERLLRVPALCYLGLKYFGCALLSTLDGIFVTGIPVLFPAGGWR